MTRFWSKVNKDGPVPSHVPNIGKCWQWTAGGNKHGYGQFWLNGTMTSSIVNIYHVIWGMTWKHLPLTPNKLAMDELIRRMERNTK